MIKNIIFDMGNVLLNYDPINYVHKIIKSTDAAESVFKQLFCGPEWSQLDAGVISEEEAVSRVQARIPQYAQDVETVMENWHIIMTPIFGMPEIVKSLKMKGFNIYLLSNASMRFFRYYKNFDMFKFFDGFVISAKERVVKPNPKIYRCLLNRYSLNAGECLFIDDIRENIDGAKRIGINGHQFEGAKELDGYLKKIGIL